MSDWFLGEVRTFPYGIVPRGWHECDGTVLRVSEYQALASILGFRYGGDGKYTFALPDLRGRAIMGFSDASGPWQKVGNSGGAETVALTAAQLPPHSHEVLNFSSVGDQNLPTSGFPAKIAPSLTPDAPQPIPLYGAAPNPAQRVGLASAAVDQTGGGASHPNMQPTLVLVQCIATQGLYPPRP
jgi:microcystin-dependent protein